ncbi:protein kinase, partial [Moniliophthora roreri]
MALCAEGTTATRFIEDTNPVYAHVEGSTQDLESFLTILKGGTLTKSNATTLARQCANLLWKTPHLHPNLVRLLERTNLKVIYRKLSDIVLISDLEETFLCPITLEAQKDAPKFANSREMLDCLSKHEYVAFKAMESVGIHWAPFVMDMIQVHLDSSGKDFSARLRNACIQSLVYLNKRYDALPQSIYLEDVSKEGSHPMFGGGFADIWRGRLNGKQDVCLKVLRVFTASYNEAKLIKELSSEILIWRQLRHPHILEFLGITRELFSPSFCIVSPWMLNGTVMSYSLARDCSLQRKVDMLSTVALAMQYLHEHYPPVIHGDIKGANILVSEDERCYLGDFGLSMFENNTENKIYRSTSRAAGRGSVPWLAPELMNPDDVGAESRTTRDIYAFGCTIFEVVTGSAPFSEKKLDIQIMIDVLKGARPKRPSIASCPDWLWDLVEACWAEDVSTRPAAREVVSRLSRIKLPEPFVQEAIPTHVPPTILSRGRKRSSGADSRRSFEHQELLHLPEQPSTGSLKRARYSAKGLPMRPQPPSICSTFEHDTHRTNYYRRASLPTIHSESRIPHAPPSVHPSYTPLAPYAFPPVNEEKSGANLSCPRLLTDVSFGVSPYDSPYRNMGISSGNSSNFPNHNSPPGDYQRPSGLSPCSADSESWNSSGSGIVRPSSTPGQLSSPAVKYDESLRHASFSAPTQAQ